LTGQPETSGGRKRVEQVILTSSGGGEKKGAPKMGRKEKSESRGGEGWGRSQKGKKNDHCRRRGGRKGSVG